MEICKMLTLSTAHITKETADKLTHDCKPINSAGSIRPLYSTDLEIVIYPKEDYGWFLWIPETVIEKCPPDIEQCVALARRNGCEWLCLDDDGPIEPSLKTYNWDDSSEIDKWQAYLLYLKMWADTHNDKAFIGCCPICYDEFIDAEYSEEE